MTGEDSIYKASVWICGKLRENQVIPANREKEYIYGFELLISSVVGIFCLLFLSLLSGIKYAWLPYLVGFIPLRVTGGGYHAKTHFKCIFSFSAVFVALLYLGKMLMAIRNAHLILVTISLITMLFFAPLEAKNKPLPNQLRQKNRSRCILISCCAIAFSIALILMKVNINEYIMMYSMGVFAAGLSILAVVLERK